MIIIYGRSNCLHCLRVKQLAEIFELEHEYKDTSIQENMDEFLSLTKYPTLIPQILWDGEMIRGYHGFSERVNNYIEELKEGKLDEQATNNSTP